MNDHTVAGEWAEHRCRDDPPCARRLEGTMTVPEPCSADWEIAKKAQRDSLLVRHLPSGRVFQINMLAVLAEAVPRSSTFVASPQDRLRAAALRLAARRLPETESHA